MSADLTEIPVPASFYRDDGDTRWPVHECYLCGESEVCQPQCSFYMTVDVDGARRCTHVLCFKRYKSAAEMVAA